jgi:peptidoglycan/LPS O-acetylase OafA/YrhL
LVVPRAGGVGDGDGEWPQRGAMVNALSRPGVLRIFLASVVFAQHSTRVFLGDGAVLVFFTLSGYWVTHMWRQTYASCRYPITTFLISRAWRLLPTFWLVTLFALVMAQIYPERFVSLADQIQTVLPNSLILFYAQLPRSARLIDQAWSLDIEVQFYIMFPWIMIGLALDRVRTVLIWLLGAVALAGLLALIVRQEPLRPNVAYFLGFFLLGLAVERTGFVVSPTMGRASVLLSCLILLVCFAHPEWRGLFLNASKGTEFGRQYGYAANCVIAITLLPFAMHTVRIQSPKVDRWLGDLSYFVYLLHGPVLSAAGSYQTLPMRQRLVWFIAIWLGVFGVSAVLIRFFHFPIDRARKHFVTGRQAGVLRC